MDPLSLGGEVLGILSVGMQVTSILLNYYQSVKDCPKDVTAMCKSLDSLNKTLIMIDQKLRHPQISRSGAPIIEESIESSTGRIVRFNQAHRLPHSLRRNAYQIDGCNF